MRLVENIEDRTSRQLNSWKKNTRKINDSFKTNGSWSYTDDWFKMNANISWK
jgi:hypothetical protein